MKIGLIADMHGDLDSFETALAILETHEVECILCAGDVTERGAEADEIVQLMKALDIGCVMGNHDATVLEHQARRREAASHEGLTKVGRIVNDDTLRYLRTLPNRAYYRFDKTRLLMAHGAPWSEVVGLYPDSPQAWFDELVERHGHEADVVVLGHTHAPLWVTIGNLTVVNPGSIYGVTIRDSHTCAVLTLPEKSLAVYSLRTGEPVSVPLTVR
ncbi:MAG: metallophosphoesterase family protein [bacterium]|nr:metallophosphoesterase family protein [bacterium]